MTAYERVRFIGYAIPTTPAEMVAVGDPNTTGSVAGTYRASDDFERDIHSRAAFLKAAVDTAKSRLPEVGDPAVLNVFVAPEFYWHGTMGPYIHAPGEPDPAGTILELLRELFPAAEYPHFLFVFGSVISAEAKNIDVVMNQSSTTIRNDIVKNLGENWLASDGPISLVIEDMLVNFVKNAHSYPAVEVRNRAMIISNGAESVIDGFDGATALSTEKYFDSNEDFLLWDVTGKPVITEQMTAYPVLDMSGGDLKKEPTDPYAIFRLLAANAPLNVGVEICLDHSDRRLRTTSLRSPWPRDEEGVGMHLVPSCGMQLHAPSVAAQAGGWAFNCDGQYALNGSLDGVDSIFSDYLDARCSAYGAHTQLARVSSPAVGAIVTAPGSRNAAFEPLPDVPIATLPLPHEVPSLEGVETVSADEFFAGGSGEVHIYGMDTPLPL